MSVSSVRRELGLALACCLAGAAAVLLSAGVAWGRARLEVGPDVPVVAVDVSGRAAAPLAAALGILGLAAAAALVATRGVVRQVVGAVLVAAGGVVVVDAVRATGRLAGLATASSPGAVATDVTTTAWSWLAVSGGLLLAIGGMITAVRGRGWLVMSGRYDAPGAASPRGSARPGRGGDDQDATWRALDRGEDPTTGG